MKILFPSILVFLGLCAAVLPAAAEPGKILYQNNFEKADLDQAPADLFVLTGEFAVKAEGGNKFLELPGSPLDTFGVLFGSPTNAGVSVCARIQGTSKGRRSPSFGVGLNGQAGYRLILSAGKNMLEIFKDETSLTAVPITWKSGTWTMFRLRVRPAGDGWKIEGKAWPQTEAEPKDWMIAFDEKTAPHEGRPSIWGSPYSGTPLRFDDLVIAAD